ncbi:hypothetical protein [Streptacidiphilus jiangxiensis]|uniref:Uncharacterized protein n=1 Tax=Streptacidiphilus jiangxiensis TaxID=235985 RepID=A0A1H7HBQ3_STRJI|nr:hypothetical protein [Streptacidiphilus jiangxiensis]SEK47669.1 hypothetical protein SAMN05414137_102149 [Streptacidiphilus jiangxiensis]
METLETTGRIPDAVYRLARLDMAYRADGRLGVDRVYDSTTSAKGAKGTHDVDFPGFWRGHVWLQLRGAGPTDTGVVDLAWGPWQRRQRLRSGCVITTRRATTGSPALKVHVPRGWELIAGVGAMPTAQDINVGWRPASTMAALRLIRDSLKAIKGPTVSDSTITDR